MCGIFGNVGFIPEQIASRCLKSLAHRGPDGTGLWHQPDVTLGHQRLSILDLSDQGKQPMSYAQGRYWITFNGEIYNFIEIRRDLEAKKYRFISNSDTEVILAAYIEWGAGCLEKFNGMWAFAIWDTKEKSLFLSRDRFGIKPLFYHQNKDIFAFSSEMKGLFPILGEIRPNLVTVEKAKNNMFSYESTEDCLVEGLKRFPAGSYGIYQNNRLTIKRWWNTLDHRMPVSNRYEEQVEQFRELFLDACRIRMRSDVPIGTCLSGGLDSSAVACSMSHLSGLSTDRQSKDWQHAFVAAFPGSPIDETKYARQVAEYCRLKVDYINIDPLAVIANIDQLLYMFEEFYLTSPIPFMLTYRRVREGGVTVTLDGHGADELFGGYPQSIVTAMQDAGFNINKISDLFKIYMGYFGDNLAQLGGKPGVAKNLAVTRLKQMVKSLLGRKILPYEDHPRWKELDNLSKALYNETHYTILPTLLRNYDRYSMTNGVEIRMPFMDWRLVTFAFSLPWDSKVGGGFTKRVVRDAMAPYMPEQITYRKTKIGFNSPVVEWFQGPLKPWLMEMFHSQEFLDCPLIEGRKVAGEGVAILNSANMSWTDGEKLWMNITPYLWEKAVVRGGKNA